MHEPNNYLTKIMIVEVVHRQASDVSISEKSWLTTECEDYLMIDCKSTRNQA